MNMLFLKSRCPLIRVLASMLAFAVAFSLATTVASAVPPKVGEVFPDLAAFHLEGTLPDLRNKVVLVDFWASWCGPCKRSFPVMKELHEKFGSRGFVVVAVSLDRQKSAMEAFVKKEAPPFAIARDAHGSLAEALGVEAMPTSFLVGADGKVIAVHSGFEGESTRKKYLAEIEASLQTARK